MPLQPQHGRLARHVLGREGRSAGNEVRVHGVILEDCALAEPLLGLALVLEQPRVDAVLAALGRRQRELLAPRGERSARRDVNLLAAVGVEGDADPLERVVAAVGTKLFVEERSCLEAGIATQNPGLCFLKYNMSWLIDKHISSE